MRTITTIIVSLMTMATQAQTVLTKATNAFAGTGRHTMQQVRCIEKQENARCWDFSNMEIDIPKYTVWHVDKGDSLQQLTSVMESGTRYMYCMQGDSLLINGYRGRFSEVNYDEREISLLLPMNMGDSVKGIFHGRGTYGDKMAMRHYGRYMTKADAIGTLLLPDNDSLRNALRLHTERLIASKYYPITQLDSLAPYTADSVFMNLQKDTTVIRAVIDRWFAPGYRYPVIERRMISVADEESQLCQTLYYPIEQQESDCTDDSENAKIRALYAERQEQEKFINNPAHDPSENVQQIQNIKTNVNGRTVTVSYDLLADATVTALVCDVSGVVYRQQSQTGQAGDSYQMTILCNGLRRGQYVLYLNANGQVSSQTISL